MGLTAVSIISSPWGQRSGAHMNPALTLTFLSLGKIEVWDAFYYVIAQFAGGAAGVLVAATVLGPPLARVQFVSTVPGTGGPWVAFVAEFAISFLLRYLRTHSTDIFVAYRLVLAAIVLVVWLG